METGKWNPNYKKTDEVLTQLRINHPQLNLKDAIDIANGKQELKIRDK